MSCSGNITLQGMSATLRECTLWGGWFCIRSTEYEHLDSDSKSGTGAWRLPRYGGSYESSDLDDGWYRVKTRHTAQGSENHVFYSQTNWIEVD